jgi:hypothetical protein
MECQLNMTAQRAALLLRLLEIQIQNIGQGGKRASLNDVIRDSFQSFQTNEGKVRHRFCRNYFH